MLKSPLLQILVCFLFCFCFSGTQCCVLKLLPYNRRVMARTAMRCLKTFDSFCFQNVLWNGGGDGKNDIGPSTNQLSRIYVGVINPSYLSLCPCYRLLTTKMEHIWSPSWLHGSDMQLLVSSSFILVMLYRGWKMFIGIWKKESFGRRSM